MMNFSMADYLLKFNKNLKKNPPWFWYQGGFNKGLGQLFFNKLITHCLSIGCLYSNNINTF